jgi:translation initiation factor 5B
MAPKKKGGKKQADDWENDLGETPDPIAAATEQAQATEAEHDEGQHAEINGEELGGGGLLAALKKNKAKRAKKGKPIEDFVEGEDPTASEPTPAAVDLAAKAPEEATLDDEDVFAGPSKKGKGGKKQPEKPASVDADSEREDGGGLKSKKEKEKEKKEREKQRKKEQVRFRSRCLRSTDADPFPP